MAEHDDRTGRRQEFVECSHPVLCLTQGQMLDRVGKWSDRQLLFLTNVHKRQIDVLAEPGFQLAGLERLGNGSRHHISLAAGWHSSLNG